MSGPLMAQEVVMELGPFSSKEIVTFFTEYNVAGAALLHWLSR